MRDTDFIEELHENAGVAAEEPDLEDVYVSTLQSEEANVAEAA